MLISKRFQSKYESVALGIGLLPVQHIHTTPDNKIQKVCEMIISKSFPDAANLGPSGATCPSPIAALLHPRMQSRIGWLRISATDFPPVAPWTAGPPLIRVRYFQLSHSVTLVESALGLQHPWNPKPAWDQWTWAPESR